MRAQPLALLGMVALFAAMLGRAGFVDWPHVLSIGATVGTILIVVLLVIAILIGIPVASLFGLIAFIDWATSPKHKTF